MLARMNGGKQSGPWKPFRVDRQARSSLIDQVAEGLRQAILTGRCQAGDKLPPKLKMAEELGVSEIVVRRALARLKQEGLVSAKPRNGILVCDRDRHVWRGHVLFASWSGPNMYYHNVLAAEVTRRLHARRFLVSDLDLDGLQYRRGYPELQTILATKSVDLVLVEGHETLQKEGRPEVTSQRLSGILRQAGVPFVQVHWGIGHVYPDAAVVIAITYDAAYLALGEHCRACGIRTALLVIRREASLSANRPLLDAMTAAGVTCSRLAVPVVRGMPPGPEGVERAGLAAMQAWLDRGNALPDLIYFDDDFLARGSLLVLTRRGIRIPEDVQVATLANRGLGPVYDRPLTRIEMDPIRHGATVADRVLQFLENRPSRQAPVLGPDFIAGKTTGRLAAGTGTKRAR